MTGTDHELLQEFSLNNAEEAFTELVRRHLDLVYSAALRQVRSPQLAEEVAQSVFADLARSAPTLKPATILPAWLYQVARRTAIDVVRRESRRQARERLAAEMAAMNPTSPTDWSSIEPILDEAMDTLGETDRAALLLRFFENKSLREVGEFLGTSDDAAQKRVTRAVDRLREYFSKRGLAIGAGGLVVAISANAVHAAPAGLAAAISAATVIAGTAVQTSTALAGATKAIAMTTLQKSFITASLAVAIGGGVFEARQNSSLRGEVETLRQQQSPLGAQLEQLRRQRDDATNQLASLADGLARTKSNSLELVKLRGEVARLRNDSKELAALKAAGKSGTMDDKMKAWAGRVNLLKQRLEQNPAENIPEFKYLGDFDWLAAGQAKLDTEADYRKSISELRNRAENTFVMELQPALQKYQEANNGQFPADLSQLQPYFKSPVDDAILQRWEIVPASTFSSLKLGGDSIITQRAPVDADNDGRWGVGISGYGNVGSDSWNPDSSFNSAVQTLKPVMEAYAAANNNQQPVALDKLQPFLSTPEQQSAFKVVQDKLKATAK